MSFMPAALALAGALAAAGAASAQSVSLSVSAPLVCHAGLSGSGAGATELTEFCNDPHGFDVYIDYPQSLAGSTLTVGGQTFQLTSDGTVDVSHAAGPASAQASLALQPAPADNIVLTVRMVPADAVAYALAAQP